MRNRLLRRGQVGGKNRLTGGFTFIEFIVVTGIIIIMMAAVGFMAFKYLDQAKSATAKSQIDTFATALNAYYFDVKKYPTQEQGLQALVQKPGDAEGWAGPYLTKTSVPKDPWDHEYVYKIPGPNNLPFEILSLGGDNAPGGDGQNADISSAK